MEIYANVTDNSTDGNASNTKLNQFYFYRTEQLVFLSCLLLCIVVGNSIVLLAIGLSRRRHSRMHFFILHLALADLSVGLITVLSDLIWKIVEKWYVGDAMCKIVKFAQAFVMFASTYMLVALSIDRYDAIARPLNFNSTWTRCKVLVGTAWILSALFASPMFFISHVAEGSQECWISFSKDYHWIVYFLLIFITVLVLPALIITGCYTLIIIITWKNSHLNILELLKLSVYFLLIFITVLVLPALIITGCYTLIIVIIWKNSHLLAPDKPKQLYTSDRKQLVISNNYSSNGAVTKGSPKPNRVRTSGNMGRSSKGVIPQAKIRTVKMTFSIVLVFILCWSPYFVFNLLSLFGKIPRTQEMVAVATFIQSLAPLNSAANPVIYGIFSTRICRYLREWRFFRVISIICCCSEGPQTRSGMTEYSNVTETNDYSRRSPRPVTSCNTPNNIEMCDLILSSVQRERKFN